MKGPHKSLSMTPDEMASPVAEKLRRLKAYAKLLCTLIAVGAAIYEMIYNEPAPKSREVLR